MVIAVKITWRTRKIAKNNKKTASRSLLYEIIARYHYTTTIQVHVFDGMPVTSTINISRRLTGYAYCRRGTCIAINIGNYNNSEVLLYIILYFFASFFTVCKTEQHTCTETRCVSSTRGYSCGGCKVDKLSRCSPQCL